VTVAAADGDAGRRAAARALLDRVWGGEPPAAQASAAGALTADLTTSAGGDDDVFALEDRDLARFVASGGWLLRQTFVVSGATVELDTDNRQRHPQLEGRS
jgi:hypothetical protein